jgi:ATP-dependent Clp protease protease subunit
MGQPRTQAEAARILEHALCIHGKLSRNEAKRLLSALRADREALERFKPDMRDAVGSGEGDPTEHGTRDAAGLAKTAALAASLNLSMNDTAKAPPSPSWRH